jgi:hypothetical protein
VENSFSSAKFFGKLMVLTNDDPSMVHGFHLDLKQLGSSDCSDLHPKYPLLNHVFSYP